MMRIRNFRILDDGVERGSVTKSEKGKNACVEEMFFCRRHMDSVPKETHAVSVMTQWPLEKRWRRPETKRTIVFSRIPFEGKTDWWRGRLGSKQENSFAKSEIPCRFKFCKIRHVDENLATNAISDMLRQKGSPAKGQRKVVQKDQLRKRRSFLNLVVYLQTLIRESLFHVSLENWDRHTPSNYPKALGARNYPKVRASWT